MGGPWLRSLNYRRRRRRRRRRRICDEGQKTKGWLLLRCLIWISSDPHQQEPPTTYQFLPSHLTVLLAACSSILHHTCSFLLPLLLLGNRCCWLGPSNRAHTNPWHLCGRICRDDCHRCCRCCWRTALSTKKACLFCRQTSFETLKRKKKTLKTTFRV